MLKTRQEILKRASSLLEKIYQENRKQGLISIYLWGSMASRDFDPLTSDVDAVGILDDSADFNELDKMREWLPKLDPEIKRLQINFFYLTELQGTEPVRSRLGRLQHYEQAVFDFPNWIYICGRKLSSQDFPLVSAEKALQHQIALVNTKHEWALSPDTHWGDPGYEYFCKGLAWLCYQIHKLQKTAGPFSWSGLQKESNDDTKILVRELVDLKKRGWPQNAIKQKMPFLVEQCNILTAKYQKD